METKSIISKETLVPIGLLVTLAGGVFWLSTLWSDVQNLKQNQDKLQIQIYQTNDTVSKISEKLIRLETKMDTVIEGLADIKKNLIAKTVNL